MLRTPNIKVLRDNMRELGWHITAFDFRYKKYKYHVLFEDSEALGHKGDTVIAVLTFIDTANEGRRLVVKANQEGFCGPSPHTIMKFFRSKNNSGPGGFFPAFYERFNRLIPQRHVYLHDSRAKELCLIQLAMRDDEPDPLAFCCYDVRKNPVINGVREPRSVFNSNKTRLLRKSLFDILGADETISFHYRREDECRDLTILQRFRKRGHQD